MPFFVVAPAPSVSHLLLSAFSAFATNSVICLYAFQSVRLFVHQSVHLSVYLSVHLSVCQSVSLIIFIIFCRF